MYGMTSRIKKSPRDLSLISFPYPEQVAAGVTRTLNYVNLAKALARSISIINQDGTNSIEVQLNGDSNNPFNIPAGVAYPINDQWIEQVRIVAGALGRTDVIAEIVPLEEVLKR